MDRTKKYILMSEKAEEIQKDWEPQIGDWYHDKNYPGAVGIWGSSLPTDTLVWLLGQDDLQDIMDGPEYQGPMGVVCHFVGWVEDPWGCGSMPFPKDVKRLTWWVEEYIPQFETMEQLWMAFIMHEKFKKAWDNEKEEWIAKGD